MPLSKCDHDVYLPSWASNGNNPYCSGCCPPDPVLQKSGTAFTPFPGGEKKCPKCESDKSFKFKGEYEWHCKECGADALDIND